MPRRRARGARTAGVAAAAALPLLMLAACQSVTGPPAPVAAVTPTASIAALYLRPAERSLIEGIRLYEDAAFDRAETALHEALREGLADGRDQAAAYKYLAFVACAFDRLADCESNFESAFAADPGFALNERELGHPLWGPVYQRVAAAHAK
jgi:hypothetical protein